MRTSFISPITIVKAVIIKLIKYSETSKIFYGSFWSYIVLEKKVTASIIDNNIHFIPFHNFLKQNYDIKIQKNYTFNVYFV